MFDKIANHFDFQQQSLGLRARRSEVIASNIANADTPNYKAMDFDFNAALAEARKGQQSGLSLTRTDSKHLAASGKGSGTAELKYRQAVQPSIDGNTVDMDVERSAFMDNSMRYQSTLTFLNKRISGLSDAIKGQ